MKKNDINKLEKIIEELRSDKGCPWDKDLSLEKLAPLTIEESYELLDAVEKKDNKKIIDELSDILSHIIFYFQIGNSENQFNKQNIIDHAIQKLIDRHPHVFDKSFKNKFNTPEEVEQNWNLLKGKKPEISDELSFNGPSGISAERIIKTMLQFGITIDEKKIMKNQLENPKDLLFYIYFLMIQRGVNPEIEFRSKLEGIKKEIKKLEKKEGLSFEKLEKNKIKRILFPD